MFGPDHLDTAGRIWHWMSLFKRVAELRLFHHPRQHSQNASVRHPFEYEQRLSSFTPVSQFARRTEDETQDVPSDRRSGQQSRYPLRSSQRPACRGGLRSAEKDEVLGVPGVLEIWPSSLLDFAGKRRNRTRGPITAALAAGAAAGRSGVAAQTVKDANAGLKLALSTRFPWLAVHVQALEERPESRLKQSSLAEPRYDHAACGLDRPNPCRELPVRAPVVQTRAVVPQARGPAASFYTGAWTPSSKPRLPLVLCRGAQGKRDGGTRSRRRPSFGCYRQSTVKWFAVGCPLALTVTSKAACK